MNTEIKFFSYFSEIHFYTFIVSIIFSILLLLLPKILKKLNITLNFKMYGTFLGFLILSFKILDSVYRVIYQYEPLTNVTLVHLCNFAVVFSGLYLIFKKEILFNITYFLSFGAIFALILPGVNYYYNPTYVYIFMITHALEFVAVIYGFYYLKATITFKGFKNSCIILLCMFLYAAIYNYIFKIDKINAMFLNDYIAPIVSFIKPFWLYRIILVSTMLFIMYLMYLPFSKKNHFFRKIINKEISL